MLSAIHLILIARWRVLGEKPPASLIAQAAEVSDITGTGEVLSNPSSSPTLEQNLLYAGIKGGKLSFRDTTRSY